MGTDPKPNLEIFIYELLELLNNVIARAAKQSKQDWLAALDFVRCARNDGILEFIK